MSMIQKPKKKILLGAYGVILTAVVIAAAILLNILLADLEDRHSLKVDLTRNQLLSFSALTEQTLATVDEPIVLYYFVPSNYESNKNVMLVEEILNKYAVEGQNITLQKVDPYVETGLRDKFLTDTTTSLSADVFIVVANGDAKEDDSVRFRQPIDFNSLQDQTSGQIIAEQIITGAILSFAEDQSAGLWFLSGHGGLSSDANATICNYLSATGFDIGTILLPEEQDKLAGEDVLVIGGMDTDLSEEEAGVIKRFIEQGGNLIIMADDNREKLPNYENLLSAFKVSISDKLVLDYSNQQGLRNAFIASHSSHGIVENITDNIVLQKVRPVFIQDADAKTGEVTFGKTVGTASTLLASTDTSYLKDLEATDLEYAAGDETGPFKVALAYEMNRDAVTSRIVVFGTTSIFSLDSTVAKGDFACFVNSVNWAADKESLNIEGKDIASASLNIQSVGQVRAIVIIVVILIPLIILGVGIFIWIRRKHR